MKITTYDVECPKCGHKFNANRETKLQPYQNKKDAELELERLSKEYPNMKHKIIPCSGG